MTIAATLEKLTLFEGFSPADIETLANRAHIRSFPAGDALIRQGDLDSCMFVLLSGKARVTFHAPGGSREVAVVGKGDIVGEISVLTGSARTATVTAIEPVSAIEIDKPAFSDAIAGRKPLLEHIASIVEQRRAELAHVRQEAEHADATSSGSFLERLTRLFS
ncbi:MAG: cyclic nucleotide-binding domain-containing protein [Rhizobiales bacterium]|nr:cyclic nucleotide-binding domain-containing protein [Hyphomicrobiales bacterium]